MRRSRAVYLPYDAGERVTVRYLVSSVMLKMIEGMNANLGTLLPW